MMSAAANMLTEMVLPKRSGVEMRISWYVSRHLFVSRRRGYDLSKEPAGSVLNSTRTTEVIKCSWKMRW